MRCPDCCKFVGLEFQDPEVESLDVSDGSVTCIVRIVRTCAECGQELKEASLEIEEDIPEDAAAHLEKNAEHELEITEDGVDQIEEGGGRYAKSYFGAEIGYTLKCSCGKFECSGALSDKVPASHMEEMV